MPAVSGLPDDLRVTWTKTGAVARALHRDGSLPSTGGRVVEDEPKLVEDLARRLEAARTARSEEAVRSYQREALARLVARARRDVPYYSERLRELHAPELLELPFLERPTLRRRWQELLSHEADRSICDRRLTSGTSGMPVLTLQSQEEGFATLHYGLARVADLAGLIDLPRWESPVVVSVTDHSRHKPFGVFNPVVEKWCRTEVLDPMVAGDALRVARLISDLEPALLIARPTTLRLLADTAREIGIALALPLPLLSCGAQLYPDERRVIADVFGGPVVDCYTLAECSSAASQCRMGRYHVHWEAAILEVIDPESRAPVAAAQPGELVVTDLTRDIMPIIRYRTGDWGTAASDSCPCGRPGPTLISVDGRDGCYFRLPDGRLYNPSGLGGLLSGIPDVRQFRICQLDERQVLVECATRPEARPDLPDHIRKRANDLHVPFNLTVRRMESLWEPGEKVQRYVSLVGTASRAIAESELNLSERGGGS